MSTTTQHTGGGIVMKSLFIGVLFAMTLVVVTAAPGKASTLQEGTWGGAITQPDGSIEMVTFVVAYPEAGQLSVTMNEDGASVALDDAYFEDGTLIFSWVSGGLKVDCALESMPDGSYEGECYQPGSDDVMVGIKMTTSAS